MKKALYIIIIGFSIIVVLSYFQSEQRKHMYDNVRSTQLKDAGQELMDRRKSQDSIAKANEVEAKEEQDREEYNDYIRGQEQNQPQQVEKQNQPQQQTERSYPICNGCGNEIKSKVYYISHYGGDPNKYMASESYGADSSTYHQLCAEKEAEIKTNRNR